MMEIGKQERNNMTKKEQFNDLMEMLEEIISDLGVKHDRLLKLHVALTEADDKMKALCESDIMPEYDTLNEFMAYDLLDVVNAIEAIVED